MLVSLGVGIIAYLSLGYVIPSSLRPLSAWDAGGLCYLALAWTMMMAASKELIEKRANIQDESRWVILIILVSACLTSLAAIVGLLHESKAGGATVAPVALGAATIVISWFLVHTIFALHYAHEFYGVGAPPDRAAWGLSFPEETEPDYNDFLYFSFVVGMTCQVSDVQVTSQEMRRLCLFHGILSFFFNTGVLALSINIAASLL
jgi:uncharacterized membrane protein